MSKFLIVYYSLTGNTKFIAEQISKELNADLEEVKPMKDLNPNSGLKYLRGGMQATMKKKPKLQDLKFNPLDYDLIIIGTPVWAWRFSPSIRAYCSKFDLEGKDVALWTCSGGDGIKAMERFRKFMKKTHIINEYRFRDPLNNEPENAQQRAISWAKELKSKFE